MATSACEHRGTRYCFLSFLLSPCPHSLPRGACSKLLLLLIFKEGRQDGMSEPRPLQGAEKIMGSSPGQTRMAHGQQSGLTAAGLQVPWLFAGEWVVQAPDRPSSMVVESIEEQAQDHHGRDYLGIAVSTLGGTGNKEPGKLPSERGGWAGPEQA